VQAGFVCLGACENDPFCQQVCSSKQGTVWAENLLGSALLSSCHMVRPQVFRKHFPDIELHDDLKHLTLEEHVPPDVRLDVVIITTPCVDVSCRGRGMAQNGQVRFTLISSSTIACCLVCFQAFISCKLVCHVCHVYVCVYVCVCVCVCARVC
jgi:site-specific DNA-cytosine methylase